MKRFAWLAIMVTAILMGCAATPQHPAVTKEEVQTAREEHTNCIYDHATGLIPSRATADEIALSAMASCDHLHRDFLYLVRAHLISNTSGSAYAMRLADDQVQKMKPNRESIIRGHVIGYVIEVRQMLLEPE